MLDLLPSALVVAVMALILSLMIPGMRPAGRAAHSFRDLRRYHAPDEASPWAVVLLGAMALGQLFTGLTLVGLTKDRGGPTFTLGAIVGTTCAIFAALGWHRLYRVPLGLVGAAAAAEGAAEYVVSGGGVVGIGLRAALMFVVLGGFVVGLLARSLGRSQAVTGLMWFAVIEIVTFLNAPGGVLLDGYGPVAQALIVVGVTITLMALAIAAPRAVIALLATAASLTALILQESGLAASPASAQMVSLVFGSLVTFALTTFACRRLQTATRN